MAFGQHWEWRGFGTIHPDLQGRIESLPLICASEQPLVDTYLWAPGARINVKLRYGDLKLKRFIEEVGDLQCWLEDESDIYPFPLDVEMVRMLEQALAITMFAKSPAPVTCDALMKLMKGARPSVQIVVVEKHRRLFSLPIDDGEPVTVELTQLVKPECVGSVACEHDEITAVKRALAELRLHKCHLRPLDYVQALAIWAAGQRISPGRPARQNHA